ncbi:MAG: 50S ribosomal protein L15 [Spirochaetae bacterium HGW-Spirochaetae-5]|nr:MAG: 50S ribosomal protein L15 [Spirochaetae bacterium HGW-Spirochaetae-5]
MEQYTIRKPESIKKRKRVGTGPSAGGGKTCGRGHKGQMARSGSTHKPGFEGGQMPLQRRIPKRGFNNTVFKKFYQIVNIEQIDKLDASEINPELLFKKGLIEDTSKLIKILGNGEFKKSVKVIADSFSSSASEKIRSAGGEPVIRKN